MKISIVTASYNYSEYIKEAIESVISQSHEDWELIIVDDGSSDDSVEVIKSYCEKDARIKLFVHADNVNKGLKDTLLLGIEKAECEWIAFLESDDLLSSDYLERKIEIAQNFPETVLIFNAVEYFGDEKKSWLFESVFVHNSNFLSDKTFPREMFKDLSANNRILTFSSVMARRESLLMADFNTPCDKLIDWWLYINMSFGQKFYYTPEKLTKWRLHPNSYIMDKRTKCHFLNMLAYFNVYKKNKKEFWILIFILYSFIFSIVAKIINKIPFYRILLIRKIKILLGLPLKDSPLF